MRGETGGQTSDLPEQVQIQAMLGDPGLREKVVEEMRVRGLPLHTPSLRLEVRGREGAHYALEQADVLRVFSVFGQVEEVSIKESAAVVTFRDLTAAYFAQRTLNGKAIAGLGAVLAVSWQGPSQWPTVSPVAVEVVQAVEEGKEAGQTKFTSRYDIQIENEKEFQVARRLIGPKGCNMKRIVELCSRGSNCQGHDIVKLRLRGQGSGFKEGPNKAESDEPLHMCVSSRFLDKYQMACKHVQELIQQVYAQYADFCRAKGLRDPRISLRKSESISGRPVAARREDAALKENSLKQNEDRSRLQFDTNLQIKKGR